MTNTQSFENRQLNTAQPVSLADLRGEPRWCAWQSEYPWNPVLQALDRGGKPRKIAYRQGQRRARSNDPGGWLTWHSAVGMAKVLPADRRYPGGKNGIGMLLGRLGPAWGDQVLCGVDLDACMVPGGLAAWAADVIEALGTGYLEVSPSRQGLKAFMLIAPEDLEAVREAWQINPYEHGRRIGMKGGKGGGTERADHAPGVEFYHGLRWFAVTGDSAGDDNTLGRMTVDVARRAVAAMQTHGMTVTRLRNGGVRGSENEYLTDEELVAIDDALGAEDMALWERLSATAGGVIARKLEELEDTDDRSAIAMAIMGELRAAGMARAEVFKIICMNGMAGWFEEKARMDGGRQLMRMWNAVAGREPRRLGSIEGIEPAFMVRAAQAVGAAVTPAEEIRVVPLRYDAATVRRLVETAAPEEVARLFAGLIMNADLDPLEREALVTLVAKKSRLAKSVIKQQIKETIRAQKTDSGGDGWQALIQRNGDGDALCNVANAVTYLRWAPELTGMVRFDLMMRAVYLAHRVPGSGLGAAGNPQQDDDITEIQDWLQRNGLALIGRDVVQQAVNLVAREHAFHPAQDYLNGLVWKGELLLDTWLAKGLGAESQPEPYLTRIGRMFMLSMVYRIMQPGCQCDYMIVLEGLQGETKTTACRIIAGNWFSNSMPDLHGHDEVRISMHMRGKWLIEIGELSSFKKSEMDKLKDFLTRREEQYTPKFARNEVFESRQCVFIGTTNEETYLKDSTGARRFWPVKIGDIDLAWLERNRDQLFAEAMCAFRSGETYWPAKEFEARHIKAEQDDRFEVDAWEDPILEWLACPGTNIGVSPSKPLPPVIMCTTKEIAAGALRIDVARQDMVTQKRIAGIMRRLEWKQRRKTREWGRPVSIGST